MQETLYDRTWHRVHQVNLDPPTLAADADAIYHFVCAYREAVEHDAYNASSAAMYVRVKMRLIKIAIMHDGSAA